MFFPLAAAVFTVLLQVLVGHELAVVYFDQHLISSWDITYGLLILPHKIIPVSSSESFLKIKKKNKG